MISQYLNKNNLHHAYLIEGRKEEIIPELFFFLKEIGVETKNNFDFNHIELDSFKMKDALNLKSQSIERAISVNLLDGQAGKKVFIVSVNNFLLESQNALLKMFEEPIENTLFFIVIPDIVNILPTVLSRMYLIKATDVLEKEKKEAEEFLKMSPANRISFIKENFIKTEEDENEENEGFDMVVKESYRANAIKFLNALEIILHQKFIENKIFSKKADFFYQILKAREYLSLSGTSIKSLMESVALVVPKL